MMWPAASVVTVNAFSSLEPFAPPGQAAATSAAAKVATPPTLQTLPAEAGTADASAIVTKMAREIGSRHRRHQSEPLGRSRVQDRVIGEVDAVDHSGRVHHHHIVASLAFAVRACDLERAHIDRVQIV